MRLLGTAIAYNGSGSRWNSSQPRMHGPGPALCLTPLAPEQLESWLKRLAALRAAAPERDPRGLLRGAGLQGLPLEQVLAAHEAEP